MSLLTEVTSRSGWGYWPLDEASGSTLADASGNSRDLTTHAGTGSIAYSQAGAGAGSGSAIKFTDDAYADRSVAVPRTLPFSVGCWAKPSGTATTMGWVVRDGSWTFGMETAKAFVLYNAVDGFHSATSVSTSAFNFYAASCSSASVKFYINGVLDNTSTGAAGSPAAGNDTLLLSRRAAASANIGSTTMDSPMLFPGVALAASDWLAIYNAGAGAAAAASPVFPRRADRGLIMR